MDNRYSLRRLFGPLFFETFFMMVAGTIDTLMLSSVGDLAVGAVGTANTYLNLLIVMFNITSTGMVAVMTQYIGADRQRTAAKTRRIGILFNAVLGTIISLLMLFGAPAFLRMMGSSERIAIPASLYMRIVGGGSLTFALVPIFAGHLRAFGHTRAPFAAAVIGNIVNLTLNAFFLYVCGFGIAGVAAATVISRVVHLLLVIVWSSRIEQGPAEKDVVRSGVLIRQILSIGVPSALENIVYSVSITLMVSLINTMDPSGFHIAARSYAMQITSFSHCASSAFGQANAIMAGWFVGAGRYDDCTQSTRKASSVSAVIALMTGSVIALFSPLYMALFTADSAMIRTVQILLIINILLEVGRAANVCYGNALKAVGDAKFPVAIGAVFMLLCGTGGTWLFGGVLGIAPAIACFIGMFLDECIRAVLMILRWRSGLWKNKAVVSKKSAFTDMDNS